MLLSFQSAISFQVLSNAMFATTFGEICLCVKIHTRKCCPPGVCGWTNMIPANWHPSYHHHWLGAGIITRCHMAWQSLSLIKTSSITREWRQNVYKDTAFNFEVLGKKYTSHFQIAKSVSFKWISGRRISEDEALIAIYMTLICPCWKLSIMQEDTSCFYLAFKTKLRKPYLDAFNFSNNSEMWLCCEKSIVHHPWALSVGKPTINQHTITHQSIPQLHIKGL